MKPRHVHHLQAQPPSEDEILGWIGFRATDEFGKNVGKVEDIYRTSDRLEWLLIKHRRSHHFLAPVANAVGQGGSVFLPYTHELIESAPEVEPGALADAETVAAAKRHYGLGDSPVSPPSSGS